MKFYAPQKSRHILIHPISRRYLTHLIIIVISFVTLAANLNAYETRREEFTKKSVISNLVTTEDLGTLEEEGPIITTTKVTHYLGQSGVRVSPQLNEGDSLDLSPTTVAGGSAVVKPIVSPTEEQLHQRNEIVYYTVQSGDTISMIAEKFNISVNTILWENNLTGYSLIRPGDKLTILPTAGIQHKVAKGESLAKIAKSYGVETEKIIEFNRLASADDIKVGEKLMIPGGKKIISTPAYSVRSLTNPSYTSQTQKVVGTGQMLWPTSCRRISQYFGWRHSGLDVACGLGKPIYAANAGQVIKSAGGYNGGYGNVIIIDHGNGTQTLYGHLSSRYLSVGDTVDKGQTIGLMGSTGRSTGPHLHLEVRVGGVRKNPLSYIK